MKQSILLLIRSPSKKLESWSTQEASDVRQEGAVVAWQCLTAYSSYDSNLLEWWGWKILEHPPNCPDLASSDFHLYPNMKKHLRAKRFKSHDDVKHEVQTWLCGQDPTFYQRGFEKWISRLDKCLNREGDYVEK